MKEKPDWSFSDYFWAWTKTPHPSTGEGITDVIVFVLGTALCIVILPLSIIWFVIKNGGYVSTKTWVYLVIFIIIALAILSNF